MSLQTSVQPGQDFLNKGPCQHCCNWQGEKDCKSTCPKETYKASISRKFFFIHQKNNEENQKLSLICRGASLNSITWVTTYSVASLPFRIVWWI